MAASHRLVIVIAIDGRGVCQYLDKFTSPGRLLSLNEPIVQFS